MSTRVAPSTSSMRNQGDQTALVLALAAATLCMALAALVSSDQWQVFFAHPLVDPTLTARGARLWRVMLAVSAIAMPAALLAIRTLSHPTPRVTADAPASTSDRIVLFLMAGLIVAGLLVRCTRITESLWYDEIASW